MFCWKEDCEKFRNSEPCDDDIQFCEKTLAKHDAKVRAEVKAEATIELFALLSKVKDKTRIWNKFSAKKVPYSAIDVICDWIIAEQSKEQDK